MRSLLLFACAAVQLAVGAAATLTNHSTWFFFTSPGVTYAPVGEWTTNNMVASSKTAGSISISALTTGIRFTLFCDNIHLLVNGTRVEDMDVTVDITNQTARVSGLPYRWYNFTAVTEGRATFHEAALPPAPVLEQRTYNVGRIVGMDRSDDNAILPVDLHGNWSTDFRLLTSTPGSRLNMAVPANTTTLELLGNANFWTGGFAPFRVTVLPPPPHAPATQTFEPTLPVGDSMLCIGWDLGLLYPVQLLPTTQYSIQIEVLGNETAWGLPVEFCFDEVRAYQAPIVNSTVEMS